LTRGGERIEEKVASVSYVAKGGGCAFILTGRIQDVTYEPRENPCSKEAVTLARLRFDPINN